MVLVNDLLEHVIPNKEIQNVYLHNIIFNQNTITHTSFSVT